MRHIGRVSTTTSPGTGRGAGSATGSERRGVEGIADALDAQAAGEACQPARCERAEPGAGDTVHRAADPGTPAAVRARLEWCDAAHEVENPPHVDALLPDRAVVRCEHAPPPRPLQRLARRREPAARPRDRTHAPLRDRVATG